MHRIFTTFLAIYWAVFFALATAGTFSPGFGFSGVISAGPDILSPQQYPALSLVSLAPLLHFLAFGLVTALFGWFVAALVVNRPEADLELHELGSVAFTGAAGILLSSIIANSLLPFDGAMPSLSLHLIALSATYAAILAGTFSSNRHADEGATAERHAKAARRHALGAAHVSLLANISGRDHAALGRAQ